MVMVPPSLPFAVCGGMLLLEPALKLSARALSMDASRPRKTRRASSSEDTPPPPQPVSPKAPTARTIAIVAFCISLLLRSTWVLLAATGDAVVAAAPLREHRSNARCAQSIEDNAAIRTHERLFSPGRNIMLDLARKRTNQARPGRHGRGP